MSAFAAVSLTVALTYLLLSTACAGVLLLARSWRASTSGLRHAPGRYVAREIDCIDRRLRRHATAVLLFGACFGVLATLGRQDDWSALPRWGAVAVAILVVVAGAFAATKAVVLVRYRARLGSLLEANRRVAQRLEEVQRRGHRVFHAVPAGDQVIDHVIVGAIGVFAAQLVVPARPGAASVSMTRGALVFGPEQGEIRLQTLAGAFAALAQELGRVVGHPVKVVPTLIAPGCKVGTSDDERYLLTSEQHCVTLVGWKDSSAYLMEDEVIQIAGWLSARCQPPRKWYRRERRGVLHACITRPALLRTRSGR